MFKALCLAALPAFACADPCLPTNWTRHEGPVYRDRFLFGLYESASDGHVFVTETGQLAMIYSGDDNDQSSIKLALGSDWDEWSEWGVSLGPSKQPDGIFHKETSFYHRAGPGDHRIYFIGYADESNYKSQIYMAKAPALTGPWEIAPDPVMPRGPTAGREVYLITSPSVVRYQGEDVMAWLGWDGFEDVTEFWSFTAKAQGDGWTDIAETPVPIGMECQITRRPDGGYVAVATQETDSGDEGVFAHCAQSPFGPWEKMPQPLLERAGGKWEVDEIIAPSITYDPETGAPYLYYTGANHAKGWWMMLATPAE